MERPELLALHAELLAIGDVDAGGVDASLDGLAGLDGERCKGQAGRREDAYGSLRGAVRLDNDLASAGVDGQTGGQVTHPGRQLFVDACGVAEGDLRHLCGGAS